MTDERRSRRRAQGSAQRGRAHHRCRGGRRGPRARRRRAASRRRPAALRRPSHLAGRRWPAPGAAVPARLVVRPARHRALAGRARRARSPSRSTCRTGPSRPPARCRRSSPTLPADERDDDLDDWTSFATSTPRWRDEGAPSDDHEGFDDMQAWGDEEDEPPGRARQPRAAHPRRLLHLRRPRRARHRRPRSVFADGAARSASARRGTTTSYDEPPPRARPGMRAARRGHAAAAPARPPAAATATWAWPIVGRRRAARRSP